MYVQSICRNQSKYPFFCSRMGAGSSTLSDLNDFVVLKESRPSFLKKVLLDYGKNTAHVLKESQVKIVTEMCGGQKEAGAGSTFQSCDQNLAGAVVKPSQAKPRQKLGVRKEKPPRGEQG